MPCFLGLRMHGSAFCPKMAVVRRALFCCLFALPLVAQILVVDRPLDDRPAVRQAMERGVKGAYAGSFRIGAQGEVWMIDSVRVWALPAPTCPRELGDRIERITLYGALDNPPVPGQPVCDCHALVALLAAPLAPRGSASQNPQVQLTPENGAWRLDFHDVRWSVPGGMEVLFSVRVTPRAPDGCQAAAGWALAAAAGNAPGLHLLNQKGVPIGLAPAEVRAHAVDIQVWARRTQ